MEILNIIAIILFIIFILVVSCGLLLVRLGQSRKRFFVELKVMVTIMVICFIGIGVSLIILGYYHQL
ncbi:hypothetical protein [Staphylococcus cohnii]|uniref:hypothetical protein n=1 Tax=Staphylococcus cohnii TaxID=29382 RepID=UPI001867DA2B|nr:hypothetical protein [Staphylococcus cohnii]